MKGEITVNSVLSGGLARGLRSSGMASVLTTSLSGMLAHQQMLDVTANNIANSETTGFKGSRTDFADQLYRLDITPTQPGGSVGGRDPAQVGQGVIVQSVSVQWTQGGTQSTGRDLDLLINGDGLFRLRDASGTEHYTRVGSFGFDGGSPRQLVELGSGMQVLNTQGQPIVQVDSVAAQATTQLTLSGTLPPNSALPLQGARLNSLFPIAATDGSTVNGSTLLSATTLANSQPAAPVTVNVFGTAPDGQAYSGTVTLAPTATVQDLVDGLNGLMTRPSGTTTERFATISLSGGSLRMQGDITGTQASLFLGEQAPPALPATTAAANDWQYGAATDTYAWNRLRFTPESVATTMNLYTADGTRHEVQGRWFNASTVTSGTGLATDNQRVWDFVATPPSGGTLVAGGDRLRGLTFGADGSFLTAPTGTLDTNWAVGGASSVTFDATAMRGYQGDAVVDSTDATGYAAGILQGVSVDQFGVVNGVYSNNKTVPMTATGSQIGLVRFANPGGLLQEGGSTWSATVNSGAAVVIAADGGTNSITAGALEGSNVDMSNEFVRLVTAQRGFQANSRAFQTGDSMLTEAFTLFR